MLSLRYFSALAVLGCVQPLFAADTATSARTIAPGTILRVQLDSDAKMKSGAPVHGKIVEPLYVDNDLAIPSGTIVTGTVGNVKPAPSRKRNAARMQGDFTPLHEASVIFDRLLLRDGSEVRIATAPAADGVQSLHIQSMRAATHPPSLPSRLWTDLKGRKNNAISTFTAPGKASRLKKAFYHELPYHPEALDAGLEYNVELEQPIALVGASTPVATPPAKPGLQGTALIHAVLTQDLDSHTASRGQAITALVTQPYFDKNNQLSVPQGTLLLGTVTQAEPARNRGREGTLRFAFKQLQFPAGFRQNVNGAPTAVATNRDSNLLMDSEGGVQAQRPSVLAPLVMGVLAASAFQEDEDVVGHAAVASNGFALIGRIVGIAAGSRYVGAGIGAFSTGRALYSRYIARGADVSFPKYTRIEIEVDSTTSPTLSPR